MGLLKYLMAFVLPALAFLGFEWGNFFSFATLLFAFGVIPFLEWKWKPNHSNIQAESIKNRLWFKMLLYLTLPIQLLLLYFYFSAQLTTNINTLTWIGNLTAMGIMCGVFGINVAHELGHSPKLFDRTVARVLLSTSLYMHFYVEHNKGHHKWIGTLQDPATARKDESVYRFWMRVIPGSYASAWRISMSECIRKNRSVILNETLLYSFFQLVICLGLFMWNPIACLAFIISALLGVMLLESVNYIEHYGLTRKRVNDIRYEQVAPEHSWNSDHMLGRAVLFELSRHSDHHANPERSYQDLRSLESSKQLPFGYPAMIVLALFPAKWFQVMNPLLND
jgi:alkane 1-monooxygenase